MVLAWRFDVICFLDLIEIIKLPGSSGTMKISYFLLSFVTKTLFCRIYNKKKFSPALCILSLP